MALIGVLNAQGGWEGKYLQSLHRLNSAIRIRDSAIVRLAEEPADAPGEAIPVALHEALE